MSGLQLWLPDSARQKRLKCLFCEREYPERQRPQFQRHLKKCVSDNWHEIDKKVKEREGNVFTGIADKERYRYEREKAVRERQTHIRGIT